MNLKLTVDTLNKLANSIKNLKKDQLLFLGFVTYCGSILLSKEDNSSNQELLSTDNTVSDEYLSEAENEILVTQS